RAGRGRLVGPGRAHLRLRAHAPARVALRRRRPARRGPRPPHAGLPGFAGLPPPEPRARGRRARPGRRRARLRRRRLTGERRPASAVFSRPIRRGNTGPLPWDPMASIDPGDTAWLLAATALVMLMVPGLALFYGGMVQGKNVLSTFMHSVFALGLLSIQWATIGYSLAFGTSQGGLVGGFDLAFLQGVGGEPRGTVPHALFMAFQGMFAIITPA